MAYSLLANVLKQGRNTSVSSAINTTGSNLIIVAIASYNPNTAPVLSDSAGNTWTALTEVVEGGITRLRLYYSYAPTTSATHTFTCTGTDIYVGFSVTAYSGASSSPFDVENSNKSNGVSIATLTAGSVTPSVDDELIVAAIASGSIGEQSPLSINSGFTIANTSVNLSGEAFGVSLAYIIQTTKGTVNPTFSWTGNAETATSIATFKDGAVSNQANFLAFF